MYLKFQEKSMEKLKSFAKSDVHSIILQGGRGSGKTYLAKQFGKFKNIDDFQSVQPKVQDLKEAIKASYDVNTNHVVCIENLEEGVNSASQVILKYFEEPLPHTYIIVTCINISKLPDTIRSRALSIEMNHPTEVDVQNFAEYFDKQKYDKVKNYSIINCCKSLKDVIEIFQFKKDQLEYLQSMVTDPSFFTINFDQLLWNLNHFKDNSVIDLNIVFRNLYNNHNDPIIRKLSLEALQKLEFGRISKFAIQGQFVLNYKNYRSKK